MRRFTNTEKINGEMAIRTLSDKAQKCYAGIDLFAVYEVETDDGKTYFVRDSDGISEMTLEQLEEMLEEWADQFEEDDE